MKNSVKIWPDLDDISQAIIPYNDSKLNPQHTIYIDLSNVLNANSSGAALAIVKLLKIIKKYPNSTWSVLEPENDKVRDLLKSIGFYNILNKNLINKDLWWQLQGENEEQTFTQVNRQGFQIQSFPLYYLNYNRDFYRDAAEEFVDFVIAKLLASIAIYDLRLNILTKLLKEIAKNSEDHTTDNAFFGMDLIHTKESNKAVLLFSFCDLGKGIHENIKAHVSQKSELDKKNRSQKFGIVDSYHNAFKIGYTTLDNKRNKGIGMSIILDCANLINMELSIFDARSRGFIPFNNSHSQIRRNFWDTGNPVGFYYYGKLTLDRLQ